MESRRKRQEEAEKEEEERLRALAERQRELHQESPEASEPRSNSILDRYPSLNLARDANIAEKNFGYEKKVYPRSNGIAGHHFDQDTEFMIEPRFK